MLDQAATPAQLPLLGAEVLVVVEVVVVEVVDAGDVVVDVEVEVVLVLDLVEDVLGSDVPPVRKFLIAISYRLFP